MKELARAGVTAYTVLLMECGVCDKLICSVLFLGGLTMLLNKLKSCFFPAWAVI